MPGQHLRSLLLAGAVALWCASLGVVAMEQQGLEALLGLKQPEERIQIGNETSHDIYYDKVWPAVLQLRADNPGNWYQQLPALYDKLRKPYTDQQWEAIMRHGNVAQPHRGGGSGPQ